MTKKTSTELKSLLNEAHLQLMGETVFKHVEHEYTYARVVCLAFDEETLKAQVVYYELGKDYPIKWIRDIDVFIKRFTPYAENGKQG